MALQFRGWLKLQRGRQDPVGDIARDAAEDLCWKGRGLPSFWRHFNHAHQDEVGQILHGPAGPSDRAMAAMLRTMDEWIEAKR